MQRIFFFYCLLVFGSLSELISVKIESVDVDFRRSSAESLFRTGIDFASNNKYDEALSNIRGACRLNNISALYWNDLGVTEMRVNQLQKAKARFLKALSIDPSYQTAQDNLDELKTFMPETEYFKNIKSFYPQRHKLNPIREISPQDLLTYDETSLGSIALDFLQKPFIVRGAAEAWGWDLLKLQSDYLSNKYSQMSVDYYPHNMNEENVHPFFTSMADAVRYLEFPRKIGNYRNVDVSNPGTYIQWNINEEIWREIFSAANISKVNFPAVFDDKTWTSNCLQDLATINDFNLKTHWKMVLIGEAKAGMFNHKDILRTSSWQMQTEGRKKWHICSSADDKFMYYPGQVDTFNPDYKSFPRFNYVKSCTQVIVNAGDLIFYPKDYWHQTENLDTPSTSVSASVISKFCFKEVETELIKECGGENRMMPIEINTCQKLQNCYRLWDTLYTSDVEL